MHNLNLISESSETIFWFNIHKFFDADPASGMENIVIRDQGGKNSDPGSGINTPDPQLCL
jgi:hypothetical protein